MKNLNQLKQLIESKEADFIDNFHSGKKKLAKQQAEEYTNLQIDYSLVSLIEAFQPILEELKELVNNDPSMPYKWNELIKIGEDALWDANVLKNNIV